MEKMTFIKIENLYSIEERISKRTKPKIVFIYRIVNKLHIYAGFSSILVNKMLFGVFVCL